MNLFKASAAVVAVTIIATMIMLGIAMFNNLTTLEYYGGAICIILGTSFVLGHLFNKEII